MTESVKRLMRSVLFARLTTTISTERARRSRFVWFNQPGSDHYELRILGIINGALRPLGLTLAVDHWGQGEVH